MEIHFVGVVAPVGPFVPKVGLLPPPPPLAKLVAVRIKKLALLT
jgi:hypothetical protein